MFAGFFARREVLDLGMITSIIILSSKEGDMADTVIALGRGHPGPAGDREQDTGAGLGAKVRELREAAGLSQAALAARAGVEQSFVSHVETGRVQQPSTAYLRKLARGLGVSMAVLLVAAGLVTEAEIGEMAELARAG